MTIAQSSISIHSNDGSASDASEVFQNTTHTPQRSFIERLGSDGAGTPLTAANLKKNNTSLSNQIRLCKAQGKVDSIAAAFVEIAETELPEKTKRQLLEEKSGVGPMQRFQKTVEDRVGGTVDEEFWDDLKLRDPLAAELDELC